MNEEEKRRLIINRSGLVPTPHKLLASGLTLFFWGIWAYLCLPLLTVFAWVAGIHIVYSHFGVEEQIQELVHLSAIYLLIVFGMGTALLGWAAIEYFRFKNVRRRVDPLPVEVEDLSREFNLPVHRIAAWQSARRLVAHHDAAAVLCDAEILDKPDLPRTGTDPG